MPEKAFICPNCDTALDKSNAQKSPENIKKMIPFIVAPIMGASVGKILSTVLTIDQTLLVFGLAFVFFLPFAPKQFKKANQALVVQPYE